METLMKRPLLAALAVASLAAATCSAAPAPVQFRKPQDAIKYRDGAFVIMQTHLSRIGAMVKGDVPFDGAAALSHAEIVAAVSQLPFHAFIEGTAGNGEKDTAKPNVWTERAKFDEAAQKLWTATANLATAAKSNNLDALKAAYGNTTSSCKACHDNFRAR
jgi:cytochrome c556